MPAVTEFAKRTGDFPSLSAADLQVLALTCQLQAETAGPGSVRLQPPDKVRLSSSPRHPEATLHLAGFHLPAKHKRPRKGRQQHGPDSSTELPDNAEFGSFLYWRPPLPSIEDELQEMLVRPQCSLPRIPAPWCTQHQPPISTENTQHLQQPSGHR